MKKLLMTFLTAALLTVCLCVPALASGECQHNFGFVDGQVICANCGYVCPHDCGWDNLDGGYGTHTCSDCAITLDCSDSNSDGHCDVCFREEPMFSAIGCVHGFDDSIIVYRDNEHYVYCPFCNNVVSLYEYVCIQREDILAHDADGGLRNYLYSISLHTDDCPFSEEELPYSVYEGGGMRCDFLTGDAEAAVEAGIVIFCYRDDGHYLYCTNCGAYVPFVVFTGEDFPHTGTDCVVCAELSSSGLDIVPFPTASSGVLPTITALFTSSIAWLSSFALCIVSDPLFLIFVCCIFVGLGIALIKRCIHL